MSYSIPNLNERLSNNLKELLAKRGLKEKELAEVIGVHQNTISMYVKGKRIPPFDTVYKIASALGCSIDTLTGIDTFSGAELVSEIDVWVERIMPLEVRGKTCKIYSHERSGLIGEEADSVKTELYDFSANIKDADTTNLYAIRLSEYNDVLKAPAGALVIVEDITHDARNIDPRDLTYVVLTEDYSYKLDNSTKTKYISTSFIAKLVCTDIQGEEMKIASIDRDKYIEYYSPTLSRKVRRYYPHLKGQIRAIVKKVIIDY